MPRGARVSAARAVGREPAGVRGRGRRRVRVGRAREGRAGGGAQGAGEARLRGGGAGHAVGVRVGPPCSVHAHTCKPTLQCVCAHPFLAYLPCTLPTCPKATSGSAAYGYPWSSSLVRIPASSPSDSVCRPTAKFPLTPCSSELDEKRSRMTELEQQVAELTMQTEYQLRLKDLHLQVRAGQWEANPPRGRWEQREQRLRWRRAVAARPARAVGWWPFRPALAQTLMSTIVPAASPPPPPWPRSPIHRSASRS